MKWSWGVAVALCVGLAVVLLVRLRGSEPAPDAWPPGDSAHTSVQHGTSDTHAGSGFSGLHAPGGGASGAGGSGSSADSGERSRPDYADASRRLPPAPAAGPAGAGRKLGSSAGAAAGEQASGGDVRERLADVAAAHRDLPTGAYGAQRGAGGADAALPGAVPDVAYDGGPNHVFDLSSKVQVSDAGPITGDAGTVAFWLQPQWDANNQDDASIVQLGDSGMQIVKSGNSLRFEYSDNNGNENGGGADIHDWPPGEWRQVTATWNGSTLAMYIDGGQVFLNTSTTPPNFTGETNLYVGSVTPDGAQPVAGNLGIFTVLNHYTPGEDVGQLLKGGPPHQ